MDEVVRVIMKAQELATAQGARLLFVFAPEKFRVYREFCQFPPESESAHWTVSDLPVRLRKALNEVSPGIGYLDLTPSLVAAARNGALPYYTDDVHWSPVGHRVAAEAISTYLAAPD